MYPPHRLHFHELFAFGRHSRHSEIVDVVELVDSVNKVACHFASRWCGESKPSVLAIRQTATAKIAETLALKEHG